MDMLLLVYLRFGNNLIVLVCTCWLADWPSLKVFQYAPSIVRQSVSQCSCRPQRCDCTIKQKLVLWTCDFCNSVLCRFLYFCTLYCESLCSWLCLNDSNESLSTHCLLIYALFELMCDTSCYECFTQSSHTSSMRLSTLSHCGSTQTLYVWISTRFEWSDRSSELKYSNSFLSKPRDCM